MRNVTYCLTSCLALVLLAACAQQPQQQASSGSLEGRRGGLKCPAGMTMMCETRRIGRIRHGTFARSNDYCACVTDGMRTINSPVIPSTQ